MTEDEITSHYTKNNFDESALSELVPKKEYCIIAFVRKKMYALELIDSSKDSDNIHYPLMNGTLEDYWKLFKT